MSRTDITLAEKAPKHNHLISSAIANDLCDQVWKLSQSILQAKRSYQAQINQTDLQDRIHLCNLQLLMVHASYDSPIPCLSDTLLMSVRGVFRQISSSTYREAMRSYLNAQDITNQRLDV
jgi:hypothetical protein